MKTKIEKQIQRGFDIAAKWSKKTDVKEGKLEVGFKVTDHNPFHMIGYYSMDENEIHVMYDFASDYTDHYFPPHTSQEEKLCLVIDHEFMHALIFQTAGQDATIEYDNLVEKLRKQGWWI